MLLQQQELALYSVQTSEQQLSDAELAMRLQAEEELYAGEHLPWFDATNAWPQVGVVLGSAIESHDQDAAAASQ